jgi:hypothetical protein
MRKASRHNLGKLKWQTRYSTHFTAWLGRPEEPMKVQVLCQPTMMLVLAVSTVSPACAQNRAAPMNALTDAERQDGWRLLFEGRTMDAWRGYKQQAVPDGWKVVDGTITKETATGDIITRDQFGDFELELEWRLSEEGNSGIFYRGTEEYDHVYWSAPEYQLLDDATAPNGESRLTSAGADYGLYPSPAGILKPANEWNAARIVVRGSHVEHWMNGQKLLEYELGSPDWEEKVRGSKFAVWPNYGKARQGHIAIQGDHEGRLSLRNIRIRVPEE